METGKKDEPGKPGKTGKIKLWQLSSILRILYQTPGITRIALSKNLKMDKSMVTWHINILRKKGYLQETVPGEKQIPLTIIEDKILVAGVEIQPESQICVITTLSGKIIFREKWTKPISDISLFINTTLSDYIKSNEYTLTAIGIALPGAYQSSTKTLLASQPFNLASPLKLPEYLKETNIPIFYDNDARCGGWGIVSFEKERDNFILIISEGEDKEEEDPEKYERLTWGSAIFLNNKMREGSHSCTAECGNIFKLSDKYEGYQYLKYFDKLKIKTDQDMLKKTIKEYARRTSFIVSFLDLKKIYIGGMLEDHKDIMERQLGHYLLKNSSYPHIQKAEIAYTNHGKLSIARGAAGMAYEKLFTVPTLGKTTPLTDKILL